MSRIGKKAVAMPQGVTANVEGQTVTIKGPKGALQVVVHDDVAVKMTKGFEEKLEINGVGFRAAVQGKALNLQLGFSHDIHYAIPQGITIATPKPTEIIVTGIDKQQVGQVAAEIRGFRSPEPYKGKGVKYVNEYIFRKEGKKK